MSAQTTIETYLPEHVVTDNLILESILDEITIEKIFVELNIAENNRASLTTVGEIKTHLET